MIPHATVSWYRAVPPAAADHASLTEAIEERVDLGAGNSAAAIASDPTSGQGGVEFVLDLLQEAFPYLDGDDDTRLVTLQGDARLVGWYAG